MGYFVGEKKMELSVSDFRQLLGQDVPLSFEPWQLGSWYLIRTVTMTLHGRLSFVGPSELMLEEAAWIADTGRFHDALKDPSKISEAEPFVNPAIVGRGAIVDATEWNPQRVSQK